MLNFYLIFFSSLHYIDTAAHMIKVTDLEYFIFIAFTLKFGVKSLLSEGGDTGRGGGGGGGGGWEGGIHEPLLTCSSSYSLRSEAESHYLYI